MKKLNIILTTALILSAVSLSAFAEPSSSDAFQYRRSSICSFLVSRNDQKLHDRIEDKFLEIPTPDQYNDHNLSVRILNVDKKGNYSIDIDNFLERNNIASRLVGKWFDRNVLDGSCSMDLVKQRGMYNASELDRELASRSVRGMAMLEDAGEDLIGNTFVLVNEAHYIDNEKRAKNTGTFLRVLGSVAAAYTGIDAISDIANTTASLAETFKGFRVKIHTRLYRLVWNDEVSSNFYRNMYADGPDVSKKNFFDANRKTFRLEFIGEVESSGSKNSFLGISEEHPDIMIRKACQRAIDDNVRDLQKAYEVFRVKSPIASVDGNYAVVPIGMKEGVGVDSEYEVLEPEEKDGRVKYKRVGTIKPDPSRIWDNRYMAREEGAEGSTLPGTYFTVKTGKAPYPGLLVRQLK